MRLTNLLRRRQSDQWQVDEIAFLLGHLPTHSLLPSERKGRWGESEFGTVMPGYDKSCHNLS